MKLFSKEKGIVLSILNAVLVIWLIAATCITISNVSSLVIKDYEYTYEEYENAYCNFEYDIKDECEANYKDFTLDRKVYSVDIKRNIVVSVSNVLLVSIALFVINKEKKNK